MNTIQTTVSNAAGTDIGLFWKWSHTHGRVVVFGEVPGQGDIYMGDRMPEAKLAAKESIWKPVAAQR